MRQPLPQPEKACAKRSPPRIAAMPIAVWLHHEKETR